MNAQVCGIDTNSPAHKAGFFTPGENYVGWKCCWTNPNCSDILSRRLYLLGVEMIKYQDKVVDNQVVYVRVLWNRTEIGRIYKERGMFHYRPRGCDGQIRSEEFNTLAKLKAHLEGTS